MASYNTRLIEQIVRAKVQLEGMKVTHKDNCVVENDPEGYAPCNCGAAQTNNKIDAVLRTLEIKD